MKNRAVLEVNLKALKTNVSLLQKLSGDSFFCPMVKANAYGHGCVAVTKEILDCGVKQVGVINADEAWIIRENIPEIDILVFGPLFNKEDLSWMIQEKLVIVCSHWTDLKNIANTQQNVRLHFKFDTGFSRMGFKPEEALKLKAFLNDNPQIQLEALGTQLIAGEELANTKSKSYQQLKQLLNLKKVFPKVKMHVLNSAALICQYVNLQTTDLGSRPGISLYGIKPKVFYQNSEAQKKWETLALKPASCLKSKIVALKEIDPGASVSYGGYWKADKKTTIATVSLGYADGFSRAFNKKREILFRGQKRPIVGTVCMDFFMVALTAKDKSVQLGEEIVIFDSQNLLSVTEQAQAVDSISYELLSALNSRVTRVYK